MQQSILTTIASVTVALALVPLAACGGGEDEGETATVGRVIDGDTVELTDGRRVRYLMIDTPESTTETECFGPEAKDFNVALVGGKDITMRFDVEREDQFGRLLAYVTVDGAEINPVIVERGYGCVLHISPNGDDRVQEFDELELRARTLGRGLWSACTPRPC
ncbi:MAG TPA: thermonuclease family protein [Kofleriaceae bacterium]|nr:thermonuclease family protein [Kofleriaceae bacterium]